jgi:hypothetical protein
MRKAPQDDVIHVLGGGSREHDKAGNPVGYETHMAVRMAWPSPWLWDVWHKFAEKRRLQRDRELLK